MREAIDKLVEGEVAALVLCGNGKKGSPVRSDAE
jgi:hypothetical protein